MADKLPIVYKKNGVFHREDGPAIIFPDGSEMYYQNGLLHRGNGEPAIVLANGTKSWYVRGECKYTSYSNNQILRYLEEYDGIGNGFHHCDYKQKYGVR